MTAAAARLPMQTARDLDALYAQADAAMLDLGVELESFCERHGLYSILPPLKDRARAEQKIAEDYRGNPAHLCDILRASIVCRDMAEAQRTLAAIGELGEPVRIKDRFSRPRETGYRDANVNLRLPGGHIAEVQIHLEPMLEAKQRDIFYYRLRDLEASAANRRLTRAESEQRHRLQHAARTLYDTASLRSAVPANGIPARGALGDALRIANTETERLRYAAQVYLAQPPVRGLTRDVRRAAELAHREPAAIVAELKPCGGHKRLLDKFVDRLARDPRTTLAYTAFHNALLDCARAWSRVSASFEVERVPQAVWTQSWHSVDAMLSELRQTGHEVPAMPGQSVAAAAEAVARIAVDSLARPRYLAEEPAAIRRPASPRLATRAPRLTHA